MSKAKQELHQAPNGWSFLIEVSKGIFALINNDKIYPLFGLIFFVLCAFTLWLMPSSEVAYVVKSLINRALGGELPLIIMLVLSNTGWAYLYKKMRRQDEEEIRRLSDLRSQLMHLKPRVQIEEHRSSEGDCQEQYLIPPGLSNKSKDKGK
jgi:hypothetical protein